MNCKYCKADCAHRGEQREKECKGYIPMTKADRIRAMSDEELEEFIKNIKVRAALCKAVKNNDAFEELCSAEWLRQPAEMPKEGLNNDNGNHQRKNDS